MDLILGTAQILKGYGVLPNKTNLKGVNQAKRLFETAIREGFVALDTAPKYGKAGGFIAACPYGIPVHTKIGKTNDPEKALHECLRNVGRNYAAVVYLHEELEMTREQVELIAYLSSVRGSLIGAVGASVYGVQAFRLATSTPEIEVIQVPYNPLDRRFNGEFLQSHVTDGKRIVGRSVFLQGLLLSDPSGFPEQISHLKEAVMAFQSIARRHQVSLVELALSFVRQNTRINQLVVGASRSEEITQIAEAHSRRPHRVALNELNSYQTPMWPLTDPRTWEEPIE